MIFEEEMEKKKEWINIIKKEIKDENEIVKEEKKEKMEEEIEGL
jgi:hypothetical protein